MTLAKHIDLFLFDMDGVIFQEKNFWLDLHGVYGNQQEAYKFFQDNKGENYKRVFQEMGKSFWKGVNADKYFDLVDSRQFTPGIEDLLNFIHQYGKSVITAIVSSGPLHLAIRAQKKLKIDHILANELVIHNGQFTGEVVVKVDDNNKGIAAQELISELSFKRKNPKIAFIGDSKADVSIAKLANISFAYNTESQELLDNSSYNISEGGLPNYIERVVNYANKNRRKVSKNTQLKLSY